MNNNSRFLMYVFSVGFGLSASGFAVAMLLASLFTPAHPECSTRLATTREIIGAIVAAGLAGGAMGTVASYFQYYRGR